MRFELPFSLSLAPYLHRSSRQPPSTLSYRLHTIHMRSGTLKHGPHFCIIKPSPESPWLLFRDHKIVPLSEGAVKLMAFGREVGKKEVAVHVVGLVYLREEEDEVVVGREDVPKHVRESLLLLCGGRVLMGFQGIISRAIDPAGIR